MDYIIKESCPRKELRYDEVIHFMPWGATCVTAIGKMLKNRLEDDEGIPVLLIKGSEMNRTTKDINHFKTEPEEFIDICEDARQTGSS